MEQALDLYRKNYRPSEINPKPIATIRVWALAADTEEEALRQFKTRKRAIIDRRQGIRLPLMPPEEAERPYSPAMSIAELHRKAIVGSSEPVAKENSIQLRLTAAFQPRRFMIAPTARRRQTLVRQPSQLDTAHAHPTSRRRRSYCCRRPQH